MKELRQEHKEFIRQKRQEARDAVHVMERSVEVKLAQERERNGTSLSFFFLHPVSILDFRQHKKNYQVSSSFPLITVLHRHSLNVVSSFLKRLTMKKKKKKKKEKRR